MNILLKTDSLLPVARYGGTERVVWSLAWALDRLGHSVSLMALPGSSCPFARVVPFDRDKPLDAQLPGDTDVVHQHGPYEPVGKPWLVTQHGNTRLPAEKTTVYVSGRQAANHGGSCYVHNGLNWEDYPEPALGERRLHFHFLGKAAWRVKNVRGAIRITRLASERLEVLGGSRLNFKMGFRFTPDRHVRFHGMVDDRTKARVIAASMGLVFPVTWHEPFGLAITESLFYGSPVFGTRHGALPELVSPEMGFLSNDESELAEALASAPTFSARRCHDYARDRFGAVGMARGYLALYERVMNGEALNSEPGPVANAFRGLEYTSAA